MTSEMCSAKDKNLCRFHGSAKLAPIKSSTAHKQLEQATKKLNTTNPNNTEYYFKAKDALAEAQANYDTTKQGITELREQAENEYNNYDLQNRLSFAETNRLGMLQEFADKLIENNFDKTEQPIARLWFLNQFAVEKAEENLYYELTRLSLTEKTFYQTSNTQLRKKITQLEKIFIETVQETKDDEELYTHNRLRKQLQPDNTEWLKKVVNKNLKSFN